MTEFINEIINNMVDCPAGEFLMGSPSEILGLSGEYGRNDDEVQHKVIISKPFKIGKYPVTQKEYKTVMWKNPSSFKGEDKPVEFVNWYEAKEFCNKLNNKYSENIPQGYIFDLPTEAQWEYACRAETTTALNSGQNLTSTDFCYNLDEVGWYCRNSGNETHVVGQKKPNVWGIYDMHGNVWEWCRDWKGDYPSLSVTDPTGAFNGSRCVIRGGSWRDLARICRSASRDCGNPEEKFNYLGFRIALVPQS